MLGWLDQAGGFGRRWARANDPWTNVYGLARSLLATATLLTLAFNGTSTLFGVGLSGDKAPFCEGVRAAGLFCVVPSGDLNLARWGTIAVLALIASGYRPRFTGLLHWWISCSLQANALNIDGGDHATAVLTLLLVPVTLTDPREWHWQQSPKPALGFGDDAKRLVALAALTMVRVQVAGIYFHAAVAKFEVEDWTNGTALYYWLLSPHFGAYGIVATVLRPILANAISVTVLTWGVLILEYLLSAGLVMPKRWWGALLWLGVVFHLGIIVVHGLVTFGTAMCAALVLYLRPVERPFAFLLPFASKGRETYSEVSPLFS